MLYTNYTRMKYELNIGHKLRMLGVIGFIILLYAAFGTILTFYVSEAIVVVLGLGVMMCFQLFFSDKLALRLMKAEKVTAEEEPELHDMVTSVSMKADIPKPNVAVARTSIPNAFAVGRSPKNATICVTEGIMKELNEEEFEGVIAHEAAHIKNRDAIIITFASFLVTLSLYMLRWGWFFTRDRRATFILITSSALFWILSFIGMRMLSRFREYTADRSAAMITGNPTALASALTKIDDNISSRPKSDLRESEVSDSKMNAFYIHSVKGGFASLFSTHPPTEKRVTRLSEMAAEIEKQR